MRVSMVLFPVADDCINILAVNTEHQQDCWMLRSMTHGQVVASLERTGMVSASEAEELKTDLHSVRGFTVVKGVIERADLEDAGFAPIVDENIN